MSLNYNYTKVANADTVMFDEWNMMHSDTQSIIFTTMSVDMGEITEENWLEFYARMRIVELTMGLKSLIPPSRVKEHIGLSTNVRYETRRKWMTRWINYEMDDIMRKAKNECEQQSSQV